MAFMLVGTNDLGIERHMIGHQRVGHDPLAQAKVFGGVPGVDRVNPRFEFLTIAAGMHSVIDIIQLKDRQGSYRVAENIIGSLQRFQP